MFGAASKGCAQNGVFVGVKSMKTVGLEQRQAKIENMLTSLLWVKV